MISMAAYGTVSDNFTLGKKDRDQVEWKYLKVGRYLVVKSRFRVERVLAKIPRTLPKLRIECD